MANDSTEKALLLKGKDMILHGAENLNAENTGMEKFERTLDEAISKMGEATIELIANKTILELNSKRISEDTKLAGAIKRVIGRARSKISATASACNDLDNTAVRMLGFVKDVAKKLDD